MKKNLLLMLGLCLLSIVVQTQAWAVTTYRYSDEVTNIRGDVIGGAYVYVYDANTTTLASIYSTNTTSTSKANPTTSDTNGRFFFYAAPGVYDVTISGTGITSYTIEDVILNPYDVATGIYNVVTYGAIGDSSTNDTDAFKAAFEACRDDSGGTVYVPAGEYMVDPGRDPTGDWGAIGILIYSNTTLAMDEGAKIIATDAMTDSLHYQILSCLRVDNVEIYGGEIVGERDTHAGESGEYGMGLGIYSSTNITVRNLKVSDCWGDGIMIGGGSANDYVSSDDIVIDGVLCDGNRRWGIATVNCERLTVANSTFSNSEGVDDAEGGIDVEPGDSNQACIDVVICNNRIYNNSGPGLQLSGSFGRLSVTAFGNTIKDSGESGVVVSGSYGNAVISLTGNIIVGTGESAIALSGLVGGSIIGNTLSGYTTEHGIKMLTSCYGTVINGNSIYYGNNTGQAILQSSSGRGCSIIGNMFYNCGPDSSNTMLSIAGNGNNISNNIFYRDFTAVDEPPNYCIYVSGDSNSVFNNSVAGPDSSFGVSFIYGTGTGNLFQAGNTWSSVPNYSLLNEAGTEDMVRLYSDGSMWLNPATATTDSTEGQFYYDSDDNALKLYTGSAFQELSMETNEYAYGVMTDSTTVWGAVADSFYTVAGDFTMDPIEGFSRPYTSLVYTGSTTKDIEIVWQMTFRAEANNQIVHGAIKKNLYYIVGEHAAKGAVAGDEYALSGSVVYSMATNDSLTFVVSGDADTENIYIEHFTATVTALD